MHSPTLLFLTHSTAPTTMDPISAVAIAASLFSFSTSSLLLVQNFVKSGETVRRLNLEVVILQHILQECGDTISNVEPLPHSIRTCAEICIERQRELLYILDRLIHPRRHEWFRYARITLKEPELMVIYNSFRDSVLLLRDLSSTYVSIYNSLLMLNANLQTASGWISSSCI